MKALLCKTLGLPDTLRVEEIPDPVPGPGQVLVEMKAAGVNLPDALLIQGKYQFKPPLPFAPGAELAGVVVALGEGVKGSGDPAGNGRFLIPLERFRLRRC